MARILQTLMNILLTILPMFCMVFLSVSIVFVTVSLNPDVKWNEYQSDEIYQGTGLYAKYYNTLWDNMDANEYEGKVGTGHYMRILNTLKDDDWKEKVRSGLILAVELTSGSLFLLITALTIHAVCQQKLFVAIVDFLSAASGFTGGYFCIHAVDVFKDDIIKGILPLALDPTKGVYYHPKFEKMKLGYILARYSGIITVATCFLTLLKFGLYIPYAEGKWIWQKKVNVAPTEDDKTSSMKPDEKSLQNKT